MADESLINVALLKRFKGKLDDKYTSKSDMDKLKSEVDEKILANSKDKSIESVFALQRTGKVYGAKAWKFATNPTSTCDKTRDNTGLVCEASDATTRGKDDYADIFLFNWWNCNYKRDDDGTARLTYLEGEDGYRTDGDADVGVLMPTLYRKQIETDTYYEYLWSDSPNHALGLKPMEWAVKSDGTILPYMIVAKYPSSLGKDGLLHSQPNRPLELWQCHNDMITNYTKKGAGYVGCGNSLFMWAQEYFAIRYGTKNSRSVYYGCCGYSNQWPAAVKSTQKSNSIIVASGAADNQLVVGYSYSVGYTQNTNGTENKDRSLDSMHAYGKQVLCTAVEKLEDGNIKVTLECEPFQTADVMNESYHQQVMLTTMPQHTGRTNLLPDKRDGAVNKLNTFEPFRIQGVEMLLGAFESASDTVSVYVQGEGRKVYHASKGVAHSSNDATIKKAYKLIGTIPENSTAATPYSDYSIGDVCHTDNSWYVSAQGTGSQVGCGASVQFGGNGTDTRQYLQGGTLSSWSSSGVCYSYCWNWIGSRSWYFASRD